MRINIGNTPNTSNNVNNENFSNASANFSEVIYRKYRILFQQFSKRSKLEKRLSLFLLLVAPSFLFTTLLIIYLSLKYSVGRTLCTKPSCILAAARLLDGMNMSADPCENFYEYVCGMWDKKHSNTPGEANSWFIKQTKLLNNKMKDVFEEEIHDFDLKPVTQMKKFYKMCMDTGTLNRKGLQPVYQVLDSLELPQIIPTVETVDSFNLSKTLSLAQRILNLDIMIQLSTYFNSTSNLTLLSISPASSETSFLRSRNRIKTSVVSPEEFMVHQITYMTAVMSEFSNGLMTIDDISKVALKVMLLEAQFKLDFEEDSFSQFLTLKELQKYMFPNITEEPSLFNWQEFISVLIEGVNVTLTMDDTVYVTNVAYFYSLGNLLINLQPINFQRYVWWKIIDTLVIHTTDLMRSHKYIFNEYIYDGIPKPSRSSVCGSQTKSIFKEAISHVIANREKSSNVSEKIHDIMSDVKEIFKRIVSQSHWIDSETKKVNLLKVDSVKVFVGYPEIILKPHWILERYQKFEIIDNDFMKTIISVQSERANEILNTIHTPSELYLNSIDWSVDPTDVNAYYSRDTNSIVVPSGILQYPFYSDGIQALNYGAIGSILGHELTHGFDNEGKNYDSYGQKKVTWNEKTISAYNDRAKCFIDQYREYQIFENVTIDGNLTLAENIADNGGIKETFYAYKEYIMRNGEENLLPAFENFSHLQLLFISFANVWCKKESELSLKLSTVDEHSPNNYRVIGPLSNLPEFSTVWKCPPNSPMNRQKKCVLW